MKANRLRRALSALTGAALAISLAACSQRPASPPPPKPSPAQPQPRPVPPPSRIDWKQAPLTPGDWSWSMEGGRSVAQFAGGQLVLRCDEPGGTITLLRAGKAEASVPMTVHTSALVRPLSGVPRDGALAVTLPVRDPLLDAMAFSRGRFAVEALGLATLIVPSWAEVSKVIEDCR